MEGARDHHDPAYHAGAEVSGMGASPTRPYFTHAGVRYSPDREGADVYRMPRVGEYVTPQGAAASAGR